MIGEEIFRRLQAEKDEGCGDFQAKPMPGIPQLRIIGVRMAVLRRPARGRSEEYYVNTMQAWFSPRHWISSGMRRTALRNGGKVCAAPRSSGRRQIRSITAA